MSWTMFEGFERVTSGDMAHVTERTRALLDRGRSQILVFDDRTGEQVDVELRRVGTSAALQPDAVTRGAAAVSEPETQRRGPGRPRLGVVAREVTLLPQHWEWLGRQPGGASVALRKLVTDARQANRGKDRIRESQEAAYRFMTALAGNLPGYEEALRALFARNSERFEEWVGPWPTDVRDYARMLAGAALGGEG
jgi:hypothetical protein